MTFTVFIPIWLLYLISIPLGIAIVFFAVLGVYMAWAFRKGLY